MTATEIEVLPVKLTPQQKRNLRKLADGLAKLRSRKRFDMNAYAEKDGGDAVRPDELTPDCGAVCCAAGWGPRFGIKAKHGETWKEYHTRAFGTDWYWAGGGWMWSWCFHPCWARTDNTPQGAAARIRWMLEHGGVPADHVDQRRGAPLCYRKGAK